MMKYNKLVRDKIPEIIRKDRKAPVFHEAGEDEYWKKLKEKLKEEAEEFLENGSSEELVDILEVINSICEFKKLQSKELEKLRKNKLEKRGGFGKRIILDEVREI